jgi:ribose transport system permease protein
VSCAVVGSFTFSLLDVGLPLIGIANKFTYLVKALIFIIVVLMTCRKKLGILPR